MNSNLILVDNPLAKHYLTLLRRKETSPNLFREYVRKIGYIIGYEVSRLLKWRTGFV
ncbi:MAG: uracil phosphoribosyltransferase, partial [Thermosphaera sp.]